MENFGFSSNITEIEERFITSKKIFGDDNNNKDQTDKIQQNNPYYYSTSTKMIHELK